MILYTVSPSDTGIYIYNVDSSPVNSMFYIPMSHMVPLVNKEYLKSLST